MPRRPSSMIASTRPAGPPMRYSLSRATSLPARTNVPRPIIDLEQAGSIPIAPARLARPQQPRVDQPPLLDALAVAPEHKALAGDDFAAPETVRPPRPVD